MSLKSGKSKKAFQHNVRAYNYEEVLANAVNQESEQEGAQEEY